MSSYGVKDITPEQRKYNKKRRALAMPHEGDYGGTLFRGMKSKKRGKKVKMSITRKKRKRLGASKGMSRHFGEQSMGY